MRRQRILERVGWRFWRCWSSSFTVDPEGCMNDLIAALDRLGIRPLGQSDDVGKYTEQRATTTVTGDLKQQAPVRVATEGTPTIALGKPDSGSPAGIRLGDRVIVRYLEDNKTATFTM